MEDPVRSRLSKLYSKDVDHVGVRTRDQEAKWTKALACHILGVFVPEVGGFESLRLRKMGSS